MNTGDKKSNPSADKKTSVVRIKLLVDLKMKNIAGAKKPVYNRPLWKRSMFAKGYKLQKA